MSFRLGRSNHVYKEASIFTFTYRNVGIRKRPQKSCVFPFTLCSGTFNSSHMYMLLKFINIGIVALEYIGVKNATRLSISKAYRNNNLIVTLRRKVFVHPKVVSHWVNHLAFILSSLMS